MTTIRSWLPGARRMARPAVDVAATLPGGGIVRRRTPQDLGACARLLRVVHDESRYPYYWPAAPRAWLADDEVVDAWVADRLGEVLGHVAVSRPAGPSAYRWREITGRDPSQLATVCRLYVRPRVRGEGVGTALLGVALADIGRRGLVPVTEVVSANPSAAALFERTGWTLLAHDSWGQKADRLFVNRYAAPREPAQR